MSKRRRRKYLLTKKYIKKTYTLQEKEAIRVLQKAHVII